MGIYELYLEILFCEWASMNGIWEAPCKSVIVEASITHLRYFG